MSMTHTPLTLFPVTCTELVTPELAAAWLAQMPRNRTLRREVVAKYARDMAAGRWRYTGESIKKAPDGALLDGQHRLHAIVATGVSVEMPVTYNVEPDAQDVMDGGIARTAGDMLTMRGERYANQIAAMARLAAAVEGDRAYSRTSLTKTEVSDYLARNPEAREALEFTRALHRACDCTHPVAAYTYLRLARIDQAQAQQFWIDAAERVGLRPGDPVVALVRRLAEARRQRDRLPADVVTMAIFRAWNARRAGKTLAHIKIAADLKVVEPK